jgi:hypothetical protein
MEEMIDQSSTFIYQGIWNGRLLNFFEELMNQVVLATSKHDLLKYEAENLFIISMNSSMKVEIWSDNHSSKSANMTSCLSEQ